MRQSVVALALAVATLAGCTGGEGEPRVIEPSEPTAPEPTAMGEVTTVDLGLDGIFAVETATSSHQLFVMGGLRRQGDLLAPVDGGVMYDTTTELTRSIPPWPHAFAPYGFAALWADEELVMVGPPCAPYPAGTNDSEVECGSHLEAAAYDPVEARWRALDAFEDVSDSIGTGVDWVRAEGVSEGVALFTVFLAGNAGSTLIGLDLADGSWREIQTVPAADRVRTCWAAPYLYRLTERSGSDDDPFRLDRMDRLEAESGDWAEVRLPPQGPVFGEAPGVSCWNGQMMVADPAGGPIAWLDGPTGTWVSLPQPLGTDPSTNEAIRVDGSWWLFPFGGPRQVLTDPDGKWEAEADPGPGGLSAESVEATDDMVFTFDRPVRPEGGAAGTEVTAIEVRRPE